MSRILKLEDETHETSSIICSVSGTMGLPTKRLKHVVRHSPKKTHGVYVLEVVGERPTELTDHNLTEAMEAFNAIP